MRERNGIRARLKGFYSPQRVRAAGLLAVVLAGLFVAGSAHDRWSGSAGPRVVPAAEGAVFVLPGIRNTKFHLQGFASRLGEQLPGFDIEIRTWGTPLLGISNLRNGERNRRTARQLAAEIAQWRDIHPQAPLYLVGYSGGGGIAALTVAALPPDVSIDRLVLVAPAISPGFDVDGDLMPHVDEFVVNYASMQDIQVGLGTRVLGTIDRENTLSAGSIGFASQHDRLAQWRWTSAHREWGHRGNHLGYLGRRWQNADLLPALDPAISRDGLVQHWDSNRNGG